MKPVKVLFTLILVLVSNTSFAQVLTDEEKKLYDLIMEYRNENGLPDIPFSKSLTYVAQTHVKDLYNNRPNNGNCNLHSWSSNGNWTPCCYTPDHAQAKCMWSKPSEMTSYKGYGYEIASENSELLKAKRAKENAIENIKNIENIIQKNQKPMEKYCKDSQPN